MKILIDLTSLADNFSGIERFAACLALEMTAHNEHSCILVFKGQVHPMFAEAAKRPNVETMVLGRCNKLLFNQLRLPLAVSRCKADAYLFLAFPVPVLLFKKNMLSTIHDICCWDCPETMNTMSKWYFRISHRVAMKKCSKILTISEFSRRRIADRLGYPEEKLPVIYCGIDPKFFTVAYSTQVAQKYKLPASYMLSLSTLEPRKNLQLLVKAYEELTLEGKELPPLVLAGRKGWKMEDFLEGVHPSVTKKLCFTGFVEDEDLPAVYAGAKLFVFPSKYEGFGIPPLEAMAAGCPVLSSNAASLPEVLGERASYFENENIDSLKKALLSALADPRTEDLQTQAKQFSWPAEAEKLLGCLQ